MSDTEKTLPVIEERLHVEKRDEVTGRVKIETRTELVEEEVDTSLTEDAFEILRVPMNTRVDIAPPVRTEGDTTIIPVLEEVLVVEKQLVLKEELHLVRRVNTTHHRIPVQLRKQQVEITRLPGSDGSERG